MIFLLSLKYYIDIGLSFLLGGCECVCCGTISYVGPICPQCQNNKLLTWVPASNRCSCCGKELISEISINMSINIRKLDIEATEGVFSCKLVVRVSDVSIVNRLCKQIKKINGVKSAVRTS